MCTYWDTCEICPHIGTHVKSLKKVIHLHLLGHILGHLLGHIGTSGVGKNIIIIKFIAQLSSILSSISQFTQ